MATVVNENEESVEVIVDSVIEVVTQETSTTEVIVDGVAGPRGAQGEQGEQGEPGAGGQPGGSTGQILAKVSGNDFDADWVDLDASNVAYAGEVPEDNVGDALDTLTIALQAAAAAVEVVGNNLEDHMSDLVDTHPAASITGLAESIRDVVAIALTAGANISVTVDDPGDTITLAVTGLDSSDISDFSEAARDAIGLALVEGTAIDITVNDGADSITIALDPSELPAGSVQLAALAVDVATQAELDAHIDDLIAAHNGTAIEYSGTWEFDVGFPVTNLTEAIEACHVLFVALVAFVDTTNTTIDGIVDDITALETGKADVSHTHSDSDIIGLAEAVRDAIGAALVEGENIDVTVNDLSDTITIAVVGLDSADISDFAETVRDTIGTALTEGSGVDISVNDGLDTITISVDPSEFSAGSIALSKLDTDVATQAELDAVAAAKADVVHTHSTSDITSLAEFIRDTIASALVEGSGIDVSINDPSDTITITVDPSEFSDGSIPLAKLDTDVATQAELDNHLNDLTAHAASAIGYSGGTGLSATDVEAAIDELANEKADLADVEFIADSSIPEPGAIKVSDPYLNDWFEDLQYNIDNPATPRTIDLIVIGDSIGSYGWVELFHDYLATRFNPNSSSGFTTFSPTVGAKTAHPSGGLNTMDTVQGSINSSGYAGFGTSLTNGQFAESTHDCDGVYVVWSQGTGSLTVKDGGSGGSIVATIDTSLGSGKSNITFVDLTTYDEHQIYIQSVGDTQLEFIYPTVGNANQGVRVWNCCHAGYTSPHFSGTPGRYADFINHLITETGRQPHVIVATGYNDLVANYSTDVLDLVQDVKALTTGSVALWSPWAGGTTYGTHKSSLAQDIAASESIAHIDGARVMGDVSDKADFYDFSGDGAHPGNNGTNAIAAHFFGVFSGDPIGSLITSMLPYGTWDFKGSSFTIDFGVFGKFLLSSFFGKPIFGVYDSSTDTQAEIQMVGEALAAFSGLNGPALQFGAGGSTAPDAFIHRSGVGILTVTDNIVTDLLKFNAGTPESSVTAGVGAMCHDTTNGVLYVKISGTGNTGWRALATQEYVTTAISDGFTIGKDYAVSAGIERVM